MIRSVIVADSSPLIALARIRQLELLRELASSVLMPPAVLEEVTGARYDAPGAAQIRAVSWIKVQEPDPSRVAPLAILVDRGEAEAIALAQGIEGSRLLLDDARARRIAERLEIPRVGTVGILRRAKRAGLISEIRSHLEALTANGIYLHQSLIEAVLSDAGEL